MSFWFKDAVIVEFRQVPLAEAKQVQSSCGFWMGYSNTYWMVNTLEPFQNSARPMRVWLSVTTGEFCRESRGTPVSIETMVAAKPPLSTLTLAGTPTPAPDAQQAQAAIYAAVVRHVAAAALPSGQTRWPAVFIHPRLVARLDLAIGQFDNTPVPPGLAEALRDLAPRIKLAEPETILLREQGNRIRDDGLLITLGPLLLQPDGTVKLAVERQTSGLSASGYEYHLAREGNAWNVIEARLRWKT